MPLGNESMSERRETIGLRRVATVPLLCALLHAAAFLVLPGLAGGTEAEPNPAARAAYIREHVALWRVSWSIWMTAAVSLGVFYLWWGLRVPLRGWGTTGAVIGFLGMACDHSGESVYLIKLVHRAQASPEDVPAFLATQRFATLLTTVAANGLYTLGGVVLTLSTPRLPRKVQAAMWTTWVAGVGMSLFAAWEWTLGLVVVTPILFLSFVGWVTWMGFRWR